MKRWARCVRGLASGVILTLAVSGAAFGANPAPLPAVGGGAVQTLLDRTLGELELEQVVRDGRLGVALVRLDGTAFDGLGLANGHRMFYAASLPKILILYGAAVALDQGRITLDPALHEDLVSMIRVSCNPCSNRALDRIGREWLVDLVENGPHGFYDPQAGGGLWIGKDFARTPAFRRDPLNGLSHGATAWQAARFYYLLQQGALASAPQTELMLEALSDPAIAHKFVAGIGDSPRARLHRKSGTWRNHHADSMLVVAEHGSYILVALAHDAQGGAWLEQLAAALHLPLTSNPP